MVDIGTPTRRVQLFEHVDPVALGAQADGSRKTAKPGANHECRGSVVSRLQ